MGIAPSLKAWLGALLAAVASACVVPTALAADGAEYALRWAPADGGPGSIEEVATLLRLPAGKHKNFEVRYFSTAQPSDLPPGASVIVRERSSGSRTESMYKLRSAAPLQVNEVGTALRCAFPSATKRKSEVDVGWTAEGALKKNYSYSCTADGLVSTVAPPGFETRPTGCSSKVLRMETKDVKIERWSLPGGALALEVSSNGEDTPKDLDRFTSRVAQPLLARGVKPLQESKTELGSRC